MPLTLNIQQLSEQINLKVKTIRSTLVRNPDALPPRLIIPGQKRLLWLRTDVEAFYQRQTRGHGSNPRLKTRLLENQSEIGGAATPDNPKRRGRPTKRQQEMRRDVTTK